MERTAMMQVVKNKVVLVLKPPLPVECKLAPFITVEMQTLHTPKPSFSCMVVVETAREPQAFPGTMQVISVAPNSFFQHRLSTVASGWKPTKTGVAIQKSAPTTWTLSINRLLLSRKSLLTKPLCWVMTLPKCFWLVILKVQRWQLTFRWSTLTIQLVVLVFSMATLFHQWLVGMACPKLTHALKLLASQTILDSGIGQALMTPSSQAQKLYLCLLVFSVLWVFPAVSKLTRTKLALVMRWLRKCGIHSWVLWLQAAEDSELNSSCNE